ncbi:MAG: hypothetical protein KJ597_06830 [Nanoarchaeota archaeon]|nr:hypothetical protein [Nanoarchaeota archaeon]MBU1623262.1 hypothetical protein [Nanoarchaeota archaeon]
MAIIIQKKRGRRCDLVIIPTRPLKDMLERHVDRLDLHLKKPTTCLVKQPFWRKKPSHEEIIKMLMLTIEVRRIRPGERSYAIPNQKFPNIKCREFNTDRGIHVPVAGPFDGVFRINFTLILGGAQRTIKELKNYEKWTLYKTIRGEKRKIENTIKKIEEKFEEINIFMAIHIHPAR